jgi:hypothetical protein
MTDKEPTSALFHLLLFMGSMGTMAIFTHAILDTILIRCGS